MAYFRERRARGAGEIPQVALANVAEAFSNSFDIWFAAAGAYCATAGTTDWRVTDTAIFYRGVQIHTSLEVVAPSDSSEVKMFFGVEPYADGSLSILKIIATNGEMEIWMFDNDAKSRPTLVDRYPIGMTISWIAEELFGVSRSHMGASVTVLYRFNRVDYEFEKSRYISSLLYIDPKTRLVVTIEHRSNKRQSTELLFSRAFDDTELGVPVELDYQYLSRVLEGISNARIQECEFIFEYLQVGHQRGETQQEKTTVQTDIPGQLCSAQDGPNQ